MSFLVVVSVRRFHTRILWYFVRFLEPASGDRVLRSDHPKNGTKRFPPIFIEYKAENFPVPPRNLAEALGARRDVMADALLKQPESVLEREIPDPGGYIP